MRALCLLLLTLLTATATAAPAQADRGEYLTRLGNCAGCHTAPGGEPFAGGREIPSRFGSFYAPNLTPHAQTGIGDWSAEQFRRALQEGRRPDGAALYPACPYPNFTRAEPADLDAIYAYLRTLNPVNRTNRPHALGFPLSSRSLVRAWQWLYFEPGVYRPDPRRGAQWNRGGYLVEGLGHCSACHAERNRLGAVPAGEASRGSRVHDWYAPTLHDRQEAGLQGWSVERTAQLLRTGKAGDAATLGPMADVVFDSLQYLSEQDALAMAEYLRSLPEHDQAARRRPLRTSEARLASARGLGKTIYEENCQDCHGRDGEGSEAAPALAGNRSVTLSDPTNLINVVRHGGYPPSTAGNPRPYGMPPFYTLKERELDAVVSYIRISWGNGEAGRE